MTIEEAVKKFKSFDIYFNAEDIEMLDLIDQILNKQIPQEPEIMGKYFKCPVCHYFRLKKKKDNFVFCPFCGQALKWNDKILK